MACRHFATKRFRLVRHARERERDVLRSGQRLSKERRKSSRGRSNGGAGRRDPPCNAWRVVRQPPRLATFWEFRTRIPGRHSFDDRFPSSQNLPLNSSVCVRTANRRASPACSWQSSVRRAFAGRRPCVLRSSLRPRRCALYYRAAFLPSPSPLSFKTTATTKRSSHEIATPNACRFQRKFLEDADWKFGRASASKLAVRV